ncbi:MAG: amino-acid N-acetyltransferase [Methylococcaceae bacterium]|nr:amino-acid N-acetyltransferase [Methylococcaceae bacterium]
MQSPYDFVSWFRNSSPYIHAHRNRTFVICFGGEAVADGIANLIHDIALLRSLGVRLVLVHGIRPQIDARLKQHAIASVFKDNVRITDKAGLQCVKEAAGAVRIELEALLSMGLANSPMAGAKIKVASANFVTAKPLGVINGVDYCYTGVVRRIDHVAIHQQLDQQNVVLISPLGYSPSGEVFNLVAEHVATEVACALKAEKLILLTEQDCISPATKKPIQQMTAIEASAFLKKYKNIDADIFRTLNAAIQSCQQGVGRVHLINRQHDGALLLELFTRDGVGTLISATAFETLRNADLNDIGGILELISPLEKQGKLLKRSREKLEMEINDYIVIERDGLIIACTALHLLEKNEAAIIACLAVHLDYQRQARGQRLFDYLLDKAKQQGLKKLFALSTQSTHWFIERGFVEAEIALLPKSLSNFYNPDRNSKVLYKDLLI